MLSRATVIAVLAGVLVLWHVAPAEALSCVETDPVNEIEAADGAFVGKLLGVEPQPPGLPRGIIHARYRWLVERVHKGAPWLQPGTVIETGGSYWGSSLGPPRSSVSQAVLVHRVAGGLAGPTPCVFVSIEDLDRWSARQALLGSYRGATPRGVRIRLRLSERSSRIAFVIHATMRCSDGRSRHLAFATGTRRWLPDRPELPEIDAGGSFRYSVSDDVKPDAIHLSGHLTKEEASGSFAARRRFASATCTARGAWSAPHR